MSTFLLWGVCAATGYTREEALEALQDLTQAYFEVLLEDNDPLIRMRFLLVQKTYQAIQ